MIFNYVFTELECKLMQTTTSLAELGSRFLLTYDKLVHDLYCLYT